VVRRLIDLMDLMAATLSGAGDGRRLLEPAAGRAPRCAPSPAAVRRAPARRGSRPGPQRPRCTSRVDRRFGVVVRRRRAAPTDPARVPPPGRAAWIRAAAAPQAPPVTQPLQPAARGLRALLRHGVRRPPAGRLRSPLPPPRTALLATRRCALPSIAEKSATAPVLSCGRTGPQARRAAASDSGRDGSQAGAEGLRPMHPPTFRLNGRVTRKPGQHAPCACPPCCRSPDRRWRSPGTTRQSHRARTSSSSSRSRWTQSHRSPHG